MSHPVIFVLGPTACGKSHLGLQLAQAFGGGILNCDSVQTYQRLNIGAAKPTLAEQKLVPHFLFDAVSPGEVLTAGDFRKLAIDHLAEQTPKRPIFAVGGSGFYIQALEKGMFEVDKPSAEAEAQVHSQLEQHGPEFLYQELQRLDPSYAQEVSPNDTYRITRALIVIEDSGHKMSDLRRNFKPREFPYRYIKFGLSLNREHLLPRVRARTKKMLADGLVDEVRELLREGWGEWPALQSVGYRECVEHLRGHLSLDLLEGQIVEKTMQLAKKQRTWFKRDTGIHWLTGEDPVSEAKDAVAQFLVRLDQSGAKA